HPGGW
ncbi:lysozyme, partial [Escherichia coli EC1849]